MIALVGKNGSETEKTGRLDANKDICEQLLKPRHSHSMLFKDPYIYIVGGIVDNQPTRNCKKFHVYDKMWCDISIMPSTG